MPAALGAALEEEVDEGVDEREKEEGGTVEVSEAFVLMWFGWYGVAGRRWTRAWMEKRRKKEQLSR